MPATVRSIQVEYPRQAIGGLPVQASDEDAFTQVVEGLERWADDPAGPPDAPAAVHLLASLAPGQDSLLGEALGWPHLQVHHHPRGAVGLWRAIQTAQQSAGEGRSELVVLGELAEATAGGTPVRGAGVAVLQVDPGPGVELGAVRTLPRPVGSATAAEPGELFHTGRPVTLRAEPTLGAKERTQWSRLAQEAGTPLSVFDDPPWIGTGSALGPVLVLDRVARRPAGAGSTAVLAELRNGRVDFVPVGVSGAARWPEPSAPSSARQLDPRDWSLGPERLDRRSEGAYVPHARYLEELPSRWRFVADRCAACGEVTFPQRRRCRRCGARERLSPVPLARSDLTVLAATRVVPGAQPTEFDTDAGAPSGYGVVIVELQAGARATLQVAGSDPVGLPIGARVDSRLRRLYPMEGEWRYGRKAVVRSVAEPAKPAAVSAGPPAGASEPPT